MDLLTTDLDKPGRSWIRQPSAAAASRPVRQVRTGLDSPNLATDQMINDVSPGMTPTTDTNALGHCRTGMDAWGASAHASDSAGHFGLALQAEDHRAADQTQAKRRAA